MSEPEAVPRVGARYTYTSASTAAPWRVFDVRVGSPSGGGGSLYAGASDQCVRPAKFIRRFVDRSPRVIM